MRFITLCLLLLIGFSASAQKTAGVVFKEKKFDDLLAMAKKQDKLIFIDAYTTWCGPCKMMTAQVFPQEAVGKVFNKKFINAKFDMEKGEGPGLASRFNVRAYPTYLFINGDGEMVHKGLGFIPAEQLLALAEVADSDQNLLALNTRYDAGDRDAAFLQSYAETLNNVYEQAKATEVIDAYLGSLDKKEWSSEAVMGMIMSSPGELGGERFNFMMENAKAFQEMAGASTFINAVQDVLIPAYMKEQGSRALPAVADLKAHYAKYAGAMAERLGSHYNMVYSQRSAPEEYPAAAVAYFNKYSSDNAMELNSAAWTFFETVDDPNQLKSALGWAMESVRLDKQYMNMDTLAWLYHKMGMTEMAKTTAREAIELAKAEGSDYSETLPILDGE
jgi:thiol-disulfide isomerase/thioredoxin